MTDDELRRLLDDAAPAAPEGRPVLDALRPSLRRARRRRYQRQIAGGTVIAAALVAGIGLMVNRSGDSSELDFRGEPDPVEQAPTVSSTDPPGDSTLADEPVGGDGAPEHIAPSSTPAPPSSTTIDTTSPSTSTTSSTSTLPDGSTPANVTRETEAGTATAGFVDGALVLVDASAAPGWVMTTESDQPDELRVDFEEGETRVRIKFELEDGFLVASVERDGHDEDSGSETDGED